MDFGVLPPEVNSGRMYAGAGSGSLVAAMQAWELLAGELSSAARGYQSVVSELGGGPWVGASSESMVAAVEPYVEWMDATAGLARQTAGQLRSAVAAYEAAFAATVPPTEIEVNRAMVASLTATNVLGQNFPAITALEAQYGEMWAQDAAAMFGYTTGSAAASVLTPFASPTQHSGASVDQSAGAAGSAAGSSVGSADSGISGLLLGILNSPLIQEFETVSSGISGIAYASGGANFLASGTLTTMTPMLAATLNPMIGLMAASKPVTSLSEVVAGLGVGSGSLGSEVLGAGLSAAAVSGGVSGAVGEAATVGQLSVPRSWGTASPEIRLAARALPLAGVEGQAAAELAGIGGMSGGMPLVGPVGSVVNAPRDGQSGLRSDPRQRVIAAQPGESSGPDSPRDVSGVQAARERGAPRQQNAVDEHDELHQLRKKIRDVARQRDALKRTATLLLQEAGDK